MPGDKSRKGSMVTVLETDMITIKEEPLTLVPSEPYGIFSIIDTPMELILVDKAA